MGEDGGAMPVPNGDCAHGRDGRATLRGVMIGGAQFNQREACAHSSIGAGTLGGDGREGLRADGGGEAATCQDDDHGDRGGMLMDARRSASGECAGVSPRVPLDCALAGSAHEQPGAAALRRLSEPTGAIGGGVAETCRRERGSDGVNGAADDDDGIAEGKHGTEGTLAKGGGAAMGDGGDVVAARGGAAAAVQPSTAGMSWTPPPPAMGRTPCFGQRNSGRAVGRARQGRLPSARGG